MTSYPKQLQLLCTGWCSGTQYQTQSELESEHYTENELQLNGSLRYGIFSESVLRGEFRFQSPSGDCDVTINILPSVAPNAILQFSTPCLTNSRSYQNVALRWPRKPLDSSEFHTGQFFPG